MLEHNSQYYFEIGKTNFKNKNFSEALVALNRAIQLDNDDANAYSLRGQIKVNLGHYKEAIQDFEQITLGKKNSLVYCQLAFCKNALKQYKDALLDAETAIQLDEKNGFAYGQRGHAKKSLGHYK